MGGSSSVSYSAANEITGSQELAGTDYSSATADENALSVSGDVTVSLDRIIVVKEGDSVTVGQKVMETDLEQIRDAGLSPVIITVLCNSTA